MVNERYNVEIGLQFLPGQVSAQVAGEIQRILREADAASKAGGGILDLKTADQFGERLGAAIRRAVNQDIKGSSLYDMLRAKDQKILSGITPSPATNKLLETQLALARANQKREEVAARAALTPGSKTSRTVNLPTTGDKYIAKPFPDVATRTGTIQAADQAYIRANDRAAAARDKYTAELIGAQRKSEEALARETVAIGRNTKNAEAAEERRLKAIGTQILAIERRTKAEDDRVRNVREADVAKKFPVDFPRAGLNPNERLGSAQEAVNIAQRRLAIAENRRAEVLLSGERTAAQILSADNALDSATRALTAARLRVAQEEVRATEALAKNNQGKLGVVGQFQQGFTGTGGRGFSEQIGQAFKFSVFYGTAYKALFALTQTFQQTLQEGIAFQQAVTELTLATGRTKEQAEELANQFGEEASRFGTSPSEGALIGARAQGFYGTTGSNIDTQRQVGEISSRVVSQLAFASGRQAADVQGNLAAVTQAYGLGFGSQQYIGDLDAYLSRKFSAPVGSTIDAVAQSGTVGRAAGFSPEEVSALAADIISRTGASSSAAGGYLAQIFSRAGEGSLTQLTSRYGINQSGDFASQFRALAQIYKDRPEERDDISAAFGRGKVQNAVISLLQDFDTVQKAANDAKTEAAGELNKSSDLRLQDIGGQIQSLTGSLKEFAQELGQSGVLDALGLAVVVFKEIVDAGTELLQMFNTLPRPLREAVLALGAFIAATRLAAGTKVVSEAGGVGAYAAQGFLGRSGLSFFKSGGSVIPAGRLGVASASGTIAPLASRAGLATTARGAIAGAGAYGVVAGALVDAYLINKTRDVSEKFNRARESYIDFLSQHEEDLTTSEGQQSRAASAQAAADESKDAASGFFARFKNLGADKDAALAQEKAALATKDLAEKNAALIASYAQNTDPTTALITGFDEDALKSSLDTITKAGGTAANQFDALAQAVRNGGEAAARAIVNYHPDVVAAQQSGALYESLLKSPGFSVSSSPNAGGDVLNAITPFGKPIGTEDLTKEIFTKALTQGDVQKNLQKALSQIGSLADLDPETISALASQIVGSSTQDIINASDGQLGGGDYDAIQQQLTQQVEAFLENLKQKGIATGEIVRLTAGELTLLADNTIAVAQQALNDLPETSYDDRIAQARAAVRAIERYIRHTPGGATPQVEKDLQDAKNLLAEQRFSELEALRETQQRNASSQGEAAAIGNRFLRRELRVAINNNDGDLLAQILKQAGTGAVAIARSMIQDASRIAQEAAIFQAQSQALSNYLATGDLVKPGQQSTANPFAGLLDVLNTSPSAEDGSDVYGGTGVGPTETAADRRVASAQANAIRKQGQIASARAEILAAKVAMDQAKKGSVAYFDALGQYYQAQQALSDAIIEYRQNLYLLGHDITNPLTQARAALIAARQQLAADRRSGAGPDQIAADRVAAQQAQADAESTKFSQRLEAVQTADELGRISHQKYLNYLQHEHDRLQAVKHRTYQQQDELNQIDRLMKEAADQISGQFNFGDIKLPTPYEVQRRVQEVYGPLGNGGGAIARDPLTQGSRPDFAGHSTTTNTIFISGADVGAVKKILKEVLGDRATTSTTAQRHR